MNNPNPFVPKGSLLELQSQRRSRLKIAVSCVLGVSVIGLVLTLIEGCKREAPDTTGNPPPLADSTPPPMQMSNTPPPMDTNMAMQMPPPVAPSNNYAMQMPPPPTPPPQQPVEPMGTGTDYVVVSGDTLGKIAKDHGVTLKALLAANPGVDPKKLHIKQKITIPPVTKATEPNVGQMNAADTGGETYVVKSGDNLIKIAKKHGVSVKALKAANNLTTDHIKVGEKLKVPAKAETATPAPAPETTTMQVMPPPATSPSPAPGTPAR